MSDLAQSVNATELCTGPSSRQAVTPMFGLLVIQVNSRIRQPEHGKKQRSKITGIAFNHSICYDRILI